MKLSHAVELYIAHKRDLGLAFCSTAKDLRAFSRTVGDVHMDEVSDACVKNFIRGTPSIHNRVSAVVGFYKFLLARELVERSPVSSFFPKEPEPQAPYIYSRAELRQLLQAAKNQEEAWLIEPSTMQTVLLLLYAAALRISEALRLTLEDVDLTQRLLRIRETKFYKSRLVPLGTDLGKAIDGYNAGRSHRFDAGPNAPFLVTSRGNSLNQQLVRNHFTRLSLAVGIRRTEGNRYAPRLHDLRHTFAVHRLISWYRQGLDVQRLLPHLATYLGHVEIKHTQRYLTMTPELLSEASRQFERYTTKKGPNHE